MCFWLKSQRHYTYHADLVTCYYHRLAPAPQCYRFWSNYNAPTSSIKSLTTLRLFRGALSQYTLKFSPGLLPRRWSLMGKIVLNLHYFVFLKHMWHALMYLEFFSCACAWCLLELSYERLWLTDVFLEVVWTQFCKTFFFFFCPCICHAHPALPTCSPFERLRDVLLQQRCTEGRMTLYWEWASSSFPKAVLQRTFSCRSLCSSLVWCCLHIPPPHQLLGYLYRRPLM